MVGTGYPTSFVHDVRKVGMWEFEIIRGGSGGRLWILFGRRMAGKRVK